MRRTLIVAFLLASTALIMTIFSPDGKYGYVCSSFTPETVVVSVADHQIVGRVPQASPFCPNIAATPDGSQVWPTLKDIGKTQVFDARPPFTLLKTLDTGPITNHVNIARNANGMFAYVTVGGLNEGKAYRTDNFQQVATIPVGRLPHGIWPSGDGTRVYVGLENEDRIAAIDTLTNKMSYQSDRPDPAGRRLPTASSSRCQYRQ
jgi:DNA-binding beta-propeller fold protein YncE